MQMGLKPGIAKHGISQPSSTTDLITWAQPGCIVININHIIEVELATELTYSLSPEIQGSELSPLGLLQVLGEVQ